MKSLPETGRIVRMLAFAGALLLCRAGYGQAPMLEVKNLRFPMEHYEDGSLKTELTAETAKQTEDGGIINATGVRVEFFAPDGRLEAVAEADTCLYDRVSGTATSDGPVHVNRGAFDVTGRGFEWSMEKSLFRILNDVRVVVPGDMRPLDLLKEGT